MKTSSLVPLLALSFALAQGAEPPRAPSTLLEPSSPAARPVVRTKGASAATTNRLSLPKFVPAETRTPVADASLPADLHEIDRPRNAIIRLPQYDVRDDKLPLFRERELLTDQGRIDLALKRHPGLKIGPLMVLNFRRGLDMLAEEQAIERGKELGALLAFQRSIETRPTPDSSDGTALRVIPASTR
ncbi:MAG: hypothetical protein ABIZ04_16850 [Opitutus sp.]